MSNTASQGTAGTTRSQMQAPQSVWIDAYKSVTNQLNTYSNCIDIVDVDDSGENKLVVGEFSGLVTIYKGTTVEWTTNLPDEATAVSHFHAVTARGKPIPIVAVSCDKYVYMYSQKKKYMRLLLYYFEVDANESDIWSSFNGDPEGMSTFLVGLNDLKNSGVKLCAESLNILMLETLEEQVQFYENAKNFQRIIYDSVTCMTSVCTQFDLPNSPSQLVVGTELKWLMICNEQGSEFQLQFQLPETPFKILARGALNKEYSIHILTRNNKLMHFTKGFVASTVSFDGTPNDLCRVEDNIFVSLLDGSIQVFTAQLAQLRTISTKDSIHAICNLYLEKHNMSRGVAVANGNSLKLYDTSGASLLSTTTLEDDVMAMRFGKIGREEGCLFIMYKHKGIEIKILNRRMGSSIELTKDGTNSDSQKEKPELKPPARSRIFAEQLEVDKEKAFGMYASYQKDSLRLKILIDDNYLKLMDKGMVSDSKRVKIHAEIEGLGPVFKVHLDFTNQGMKPLTDMVLSLHFPGSNYQLLESVPALSVLIPSVMASVTLRIKNISPLGLNEPIKAFLLQRNDCKPVAGAIINMPPCDVQP